MVLGLLVGAACHGGTAGHTPPAPGPSRVANLHAFARLYGVIRWFHPSDAAAVIDWDQLAIDGVRRVIGAVDERALQVALTELIAPIAPTVHVVAAEQRFPDDSALHPAAAADLETVAWEHKGYGDSTLTTVYASKRRHRERVVAADGAPFAALWQAIDAAPFRGGHVRLRGRLRTAHHALGRLWLRVERGDTNGFFDNMDVHPVLSTTWESAEIVGPVDASATRIVFGMLLSGNGTSWFDDLELAVQGPDGGWKPIEIKDPGFESGEPLASWSPGIGKPRLASLDGWNATLDRSNPASGSASLRLEAATKVVADELFAEGPRPGETIDVDLGAGLRARVPLALYSRDGHTIGDDPALARRAQLGAPAATPGHYDVDGGLADVTVVWNVLEHFWPYWDLVSVNWLTQLDASLADALDDQTVDDHVATLQRLSAAAPDGHATSSCPGASRRATLPFNVELIEGQIVVTATVDPLVERGDVIVSIEGRPAVDELAAEEALTSGSPQYRRVQASRRFGAGAAGTKVNLRLRRGSSTVDVTAERGDRTVEDVSHPPIDRLDDGVYYVDLARASKVSVDEVMERLATAPGVVFDLRRYPSANHDVLSHLVTRVDDAKSWMFLPHVVRPDHGSSSISTWEPLNRELPVLRPHIAGHVAFVTGPEAISYAETLMEVVEHYHLGAIVGSATAGTNGNVAEITEPTSCRTTFTGLRVTKPDGARHYMVGVQPTIPASRTIAGVVAGRDEVLEKALSYVRGASH